MLGSILKADSRDVQGRIVNKGTGRKVIPFRRQLIGVV